MKVTYFDIKEVRVLTIPVTKVIVGAEWVTIFKKDKPSLVIQISNLLSVEDN